MIRVALNYSTTQPLNLAAEEVREYTSHAMYYYYYIHINFTSMNFDEAHQPVPGFPEMYKHSKFWREKCWHKEKLAGKLMTILTRL